MPSSSQVLEPDCPILSTLVFGDVSSTSVPPLPTPGPLSVVLTTAECACSEGSGVPQWRARVRKGVVTCRARSAVVERAPPVCVACACSFPLLIVCLTMLHISGSKHGAYFEDAWPGHKHLLVIPLGRP